MVVMFGCMLSVTKFPANVSRYCIMVNMVLHLSFDYSFACLMSLVQNFM